MNPAVPKVPHLCHPMLAALASLGGSASNEEIDDRLGLQMQLGEDVRSILHDDGPLSEFSYRAAWARSWLKNAGLVENSMRGVWSLTAEGRLLLDARPDELMAIVRRALDERRKERAAKPKGKALARVRERDTGTRPATRTSVAIDAETRAEDGLEAADRAIGSAIDQAEAWRERLLELLLAMPPDAFERLCQRLLRESGFIRVEVSGRSGDGGIDGTGVLRLNLLSFYVIFQSKRWRGSVGSSVVRDFRGAMVGRADKGLIITTGTFTADARREATRDGAPAIDLIDGDALCDLLRDLKIGVDVEMVPEVTINEAAFAAF